MVEHIVDDLWRCGISINLTADGMHLSVPARRLTPEQRDRILAHKPELVAFLHVARETTEQLLAAAMQACDHWQDSPQARQEMRQQCLELPLHKRAEMRDYFDKNYGKRP